jgi:restriction system protein
MQDLSPLERRLFDWLSRRSDLVLVSIPVAVFLVVGAVGVLLVSVVSHRSPFMDSYSTWLITAIGFAGSLLYIASFYVLAAFFIRTRRFKLLELHQTMRDIRSMTWREFEDLVAAAYQASGYDVEARGGDLADGGIDLIVRKDNKRWIVQCKHYRDQWVGVRPIRELLGIVTAQKATGGVLVASGVFDEQAQAFARQTTQLELIGGEQLLDLINHAAHKPATTKCPECGSALREKTGRFGPFLGCVNFPACRGWVPLASQVKAR